MIDAVVAAVHNLVVRRSTNYLDISPNPPKILVMLYIEDFMESIGMEVSGEPTTSLKEAAAK